MTDLNIAVVGYQGSKWKIQLKIMTATVLCGDIMQKNYKQVNFVCKSIYHFIKMGNFAEIYDEKNSTVRTSGRQANQKKYLLQSVRTQNEKWCV